jgi:RNA polymerase sigma factor (sigma-70 family)
LSDLARERGAAKVVSYRADPPEAEDPISGPADLAEWSEFYEKIDGLADEEREMFDLLFYEGLTQKEASAVLATSVRSVKRRWQRARMSLAHALHGEWPRV